MPWLHALAKLLSAIATRSASGFETDILELTVACDPLFQFLLILFYFSFILFFKSHVWKQPNILQIYQILFRLFPYSKPGFSLSLTAR